MTQHSDLSKMPWSEETSQQFIEQGQIHIPQRNEIQDTLLDLIPAEPDEPFLAVELGIGSGWLCEAILTRFPAASMVGLDGSPTMLRASEARLRPFAGRFEARQFRLEDRSWLATLPSPARCFVSSLAIHHLDGAGKQALYRDVYAQLDPHGGLLIADLVAPRSERERRYMAQGWNAEVKRQSLSFTGNLDVYQQFVDERYNWFDYPDPMDMPSTIPEHLEWLTQAGFIGADVFWARAGHAVYGAYKE